MPWGEVGNRSLGTYGFSRGSDQIVRSSIHTLHGEGRAALDVRSELLQEFLGMEREELVRCQICLMGPTWRSLGSADSPTKLATKRLLLLFEAGVLGTL